MLADAPHPERGVRLAELHPAARRSRARRRTTTCTRTPNDEAKEFVEPEILADPAIFPPDEAWRSSRARRTPRAARSATTSGRSSSRRSAAESTARPRPRPWRLIDRDGDADRAPEPAASRLRNRLLTFALLLPAGRLVPVLLVAAARHRRHLLVRHPGEERRLRAGLRVRQLRARHLRSPSRSSRACRWRSPGRSAASSSACRSRTSSRRGPAATRALLILLAGHPVLDELPHPDLRLADRSSGRTSGSPASSRSLIGAETSRSWARRSRSCSASSTATCR